MHDRNIPTAGWGWQEVNASPTYPGIQLQFGAWFITVQEAYRPQMPGHGSTHLLRMQALSDGQSELNTHSGLHSSYGFPW